LLSASICSVTGTFFSSVRQMCPYCSTASTICAGEGISRRASRSDEQCRRRRGDIEHRRDAFVNPELRLLAREGLIELPASMAMPAGGCFERSASSASL
jgi:hypothetical protein